MPPPKTTGERLSVCHASAISAKPPADAVPLQYPTRMTGSISLLTPLRFVVAEPSRRAANPSHNLTGATRRSGSLQGTAGFERKGDVVCGVVGPPHRPFLLTVSIHDHLVGESSSRFLFSLGRFIIFAFANAPAPVRQRKAHWVISQLRSNPAQAGIPSSVNVPFG